MTITITIIATLATHPTTIPAICPPLNFDLLSSPLFIDFIAIFLFSPVCNGSLFKHSRELNSVFP